MRLRTSRRRWSILAVIGCCLGIYVVFAVAFHWFVEPTMGKSYAAYAPPAYQPPTSRAPAAAVAGHSAAVAPAASPIAPELPRVAAAFAALPDAAEKTTAAEEEKTTDVAPKDAPKKHAAHARHERSGRHIRGPWDFASSLFSGSRRWF